MRACRGRTKVRSAAAANRFTLSGASDGTSRGNHIWGNACVAANVLIAEDEPNLVESLTFILRREGCSVTAVFDGEAVMERLRAELPDVLILDVMLPKRNGFDILKLIKADPRLTALPVMVLTAKGQERDRKTAEQLGADAYVTKPFSNRDVVERIKRLAGF